MISSKLYYLLFILLAHMPDSTQHLSAVELKEHTIILCSGEELAPEGRCTGSRYCTACTTCNYCKHCNSGGSCGVCGGGSSRRTYSPSYYSKDGTNRYSKPSNPYTTQPVFTPEKQHTIIIVNDLYIVTQATSLRQRATHKSNVLLRFAPGDEATLLEPTDKYWWKVVFNGKVGWVKKALLRKK